MKKLMTLALGLSFLMGTITTVAFGQETTKKETKKKKGKKKKTEEDKKETR
jgi:hypothetical protein